MTTTKTILLFRQIQDRAEWLRLTTERVNTGWYTDAECSKPATEAEAGKAGEDIYTRDGWNVEPKHYPALAHIEAGQSSTDAGETLAAQWCDDHYVIAHSGVLWLSNDGDNWIDDSTGHPVIGRRFDDATIALRGGPRDGETVA